MLRRFQKFNLKTPAVKTTLDLTRFSPNVYMKKSTSENIVLIRGVSSFESSIYSPTGFYVDDVNFPLHYMHNVDLVDIERIEVLKGPQGSLYGRNSESGVINILTRQPDNTFRGRLNGDISGYGDFSDVRGGFSVSGPAIENMVFWGLSYQTETSDGYIKNLFNDDEKANRKKHRIGRGVLRWTPTERVDMSLIADWMDNDDQIGFYRFTTGPYKTERHQISHDSDEYSKEDGNGQAFRVKYRGALYDLLSVTGRRNYKNDNVQDFDCFSDPANNWGSTHSIYENRHVSQELRLSSAEKNSALTWLIGLYGFEEKTDIQQDNETASNFRKTDIEINGHAVFAQSTYRFFERFDLTAGIRYDYQKQLGKRHQDYLDSSTWMPSSADYEKELISDEVLPKLSLGCDCAENVYVYALISKGYLSGGITTLPKRRMKMRLPTLPSIPGIMKPESRPRG